MDFIIGTGERILFSCICGLTGKTDAESDEY
jgi:hypothetical protein